MAKGDVGLFNQFRLDIGDEVYQLSTDTYKVGLVDSTTTPTATTADPRWGAGGTTNFSTNEVTAGGNYTAGGPSLGVSDHWTISGGTSTFDGDDVSILQNASNPTNARWGIIYNDTAAGKNAVGWVDLGSDSDLTSGDFSITWNASGIFTLA